MRCYTGHSLKICLIKVGIPVFIPLSIAPVIQEELLRGIKIQGVYFCQKAFRIVIGINCLSSLSWGFDVYEIFIYK